MKKTLSAAVSVLLCFVFCFNAFAAETKLTTVVPSTHEITVVYNDGGYILYKGEIIESGATVTVNRFDEAIFAAVCTQSCHINSVTVNGEDVTDSMLYGRLIFESVNDDAELVFTFDDCPVDDSGNVDVEQDKCSHIEMSGGVFLNDDPFPGAVLEIDYGEITVTADEDGKYSIDDIKDGYHIVRVLNGDGNPAGNTAFALYITPDAEEISVEILEDGTRLVTVPSGDGSVKLDFIVRTDGGVDIVPSAEEEKPAASNPITENPVIAKTGEFIRENPAVLFGLMIFSLFIFFLILFIRRKDDDEEENKAR